MTSPTGGRARPGREGGIHELELVDCALHLRRRERGLVLDHRDLREAVLAHERDRFSHRVVRVHVDERRQRLAPRVEHRRDAEVARTQEAEVRHPVVVEDPRQVAAAESGTSTTTTSVLAASWATRTAAATAVPPDPPMSSPSSRATLRAMRNDASSLTAITRSTTDGS
jgi:hypothetical protein